MPFTAFTLQIGGYHSYQHRKLQAAQVTITDSTVSAFEASSATLLKVGRGSMKMLPWTLVSVRNGRLWNGPRN